MALSVLTSLVIAKFPSIGANCFLPHHAELYRQHFKLVKDIRITGVYDRQEYNSENLLEGLLGLNSHFLRKTIWMDHQHFITENSGSNPVTALPILSTLNISEEEVKGEFEEKLQQLDVHLARVFIGQSPEALLNYFQSVDPKIVTYSARCLTVVLFSTSSATTTKSTILLLTFLWAKLSFVNVLVHFPCSLKLQEYVFTYKPFYRNGDFCGQSRRYHYTDVLKYPQLLVNDVKNLNYCPLVLSLFQRYPTATATPPNFLLGSRVYEKIPLTSKFYGADGVAMSVLSEYMNFSISLSTSEESGYYGTVTKSGAPTGSLKATVERSIDLQGNSRFMKPYGIEGYDLTYIFDFDKMCVVVPTAGKLSKWRGTLDILTANIALSSLVVLVICGAINRKIFRSCGLDVCAAFLGQSIMYGVTDQSLPKRIFLGSFFVYSIVISTIFSGALLSVYAYQKYLPDIETLEEFEKSGLPARASFNPFEDVSTPLYQRLAKKISRKIAKVDDNYTSMEIAAVFHIAGIERYLDGKILIQARFSDKDGHSQLHIIPECPNSYFLSFIVPLGSPYLKVVNRFLIKVNEVGLASKWHQDFADGFVYDARIRRLDDDTDEDNNGFKPFDWEDLKCIMAIWLIGLVIAFAVLILEIFCFQI